LNPHDVCSKLDRQASLWRKMTGLLSTAKTLLPKSTGLRVASLIILVCAVPLLGSTVRYLKNISWNVQVSFQGTFDNASRFVAHNSGRSEQFVRIARFVLSTARFGKLDWDEFESRMADPGRFVPPAASAEFSVDAPVDTEEYLCSSLRAIGFFAQYGALNEGRLVPDGEPASLRTRKIVEDLSCSFDVADRDSSVDSNVRQKDANSNARQKIPVPCGQVRWISDCVSQLMPPGR
jgi:hypothetical protein